MQLPTFAALVSTALSAGPSSSVSVSAFLPSAPTGGAAAVATSFGRDGLRLFQSASEASADAPSTTGAADEASASSAQSSFVEFDYKSHWYPVVWARDLKPSRPTKVTLFDVDYAVAKVVSDKDGSEGRVEEAVAMVDACPHKSASLSEGRVTSGGSFQCAYHGWTFDSKSGRCLEIPQVENRRPSGAEQNSQGGGSGPAKKGRADGAAVPAMIHQGMVWLFPYGGLEEALQAPPPPSVPEIDEKGFRATGEIVRDFPDVDWTILLENIMDPDHGLFAHQATAFDFYSASKINPQKTVETETDGGKGWVITSTTKSVPKLLARNDEMNGKKPKEGQGTPADKLLKKDVKKAKSDVVKEATTTFVAPTTVYMGRRDPSTGETGFVTAFWVCPTGSGKSRFMAASVGKIPGWLNIPRWFSHLNLNNFLDQDTYLIATQNRHVMATESQLFVERAEADDREEGNATTTKTRTTNVPVRKTLYAYRSPTEKMGARVGSFFDATLGRVPGRARAMRDLGGRERVLNAGNPPREVVLDRYVQHTNICQDSMDVVKNCEKVIKAAKIVALIPVALKVLFAGASSVAASSSVVTRALSRCNAFLSARPGLVLGTWIASAVVGYLSNKLRKEFYFKYTDKYRERDMDNIPKSVWMDHV